MPVGLFERGECPSDSAPVNARAHIGILYYVSVIVIAKERRMCNPGIERTCTDGQQQTKDYGALPESIRHMIIESGFEREASWIVGTKKKSPAVCWAFCFVKESIWFRCQAWQ